MSGSQTHGRLRATMSSAELNPDKAQTGSANAGANAANATGGNTTSPERRPSLATPEEFVKKYGGKRAINKVLIANNGIAGEVKLFQRR